ncbi:DUF4003 domain-containing protein [Dehalobacter sp. DCM]|uniref:DUF4003 domain-containing protein n=1 Tax=Dehalobacter sp. DCM TaxID=2907827 RepID=UPI0030816E1C|nr:DUF4003 domain-containing protein [Dehalobacter sp. DCM]
MDSYLRQKADKLISVYQQVSKDYRWKNSSMMNDLIAITYVMKDRTYSKEELEAVNDYIKKNTGTFSCYRQKSVLFSALLLLNFPDPEAKFDTLLSYENKLKEVGFRSYNYRPLTAFTLLLSCEPRKSEMRMAKAFDIFTEMKKNHPWLTSGDDYPISILLAASEKPVESILTQIEALYTELHAVGFSRGNGLQYLSHILSLSEENYKTKASRSRKIYDFFGQNKLKIYSNNYGSLGLLTLLEDSSQHAVRSVLQLSDYLREDRSIRWLGKETVFLTSASLVSYTMLEHMKENRDAVSMNTFVTFEALIAAQDAAMLGAACAATTAATGS